MSAADQAKKLKIKVSSCKRLQKEYESYEKEEKKQSEKIQKMKAEGADPYDIKKQEEVLADTQQMFPDTKKRLDSTLQDLAEHVKLCSGQSQIVGTEDWNAAQELIKNI
eukprot:TRINITY_DN17340_c0_g1_i1.p1 TRINITY_DN17340_c0_g1~~TRINITY_DN17340_c0_g1_i1.p1  ORF type:complete len:118 (-),score=36.29 TRINITY_DN17340_c0_g1_i1:107-433(-)